MTILFSVIKVTLFFSVVLHITKLITIEERCFTFGAMTSDKCENDLTKRTISDKTNKSCYNTRIYYLRSRFLLSEIFYFRHYITNIPYYVVYLPITFKIPHSKINDLNLIFLFLFNETSLT